MRMRVSFEVRPTTATKQGQPVRRAPTYVCPCNVEEGGIQKNSTFQREKHILSGYSTRDIPEIPGPGAALRAARSEVRA